MRIIYEERGRKKEERGERERGREREILEAHNSSAEAEKNPCFLKKIQTQRRGRIGLYLYMWGYGF